MLTWTKHICKTFSVKQKHEICQRKCVLLLRIHCLKHSLPVMWLLLYGRYFKILAFMYLSHCSAPLICSQAITLFSGVRNSFFICLHLNNNFNISDLYMWHRSWVGNLFFTEAWGKMTLDEGWRLSRRGSTGRCEFSIQNS